MNILSNWLRAYVPNIAVDDRQLADDLTLRGIAVEGVHDLGPGNGALFEMDITTNRGPGRAAIPGGDRGAGVVWAFYRAGAARGDHCAVGGPGCRDLRADRLQADFECGGRVELRAAGHGASNPCFRSRQD